MADRARFWQTSFGILISAQLISCETQPSKEPPPAGVIGGLISWIAQGVAGTVIGDGTNGLLDDIFGDGGNTAPSYNNDFHQIEQTLASVQTMISGDMAQLESLTESLSQEYEAAIELSFYNDVGQLVQNVQVADFRDQWAQAAETLQSFNETILSLDNGCSSPYFAQFYKSEDIPPTLETAYEVSRNLRSNAGEWSTIALSANDWMAQVPKTSGANLLAGMQLYNLAYLRFTLAVYGLLQVSYNTYALGLSLRANCEEYSNMVFPDPEVSFTGVLSDDLVTLNGMYGQYASNLSSKLQSLDSPQTAPEFLEDAPFSLNFDEGLFQDCNATALVVSASLVLDREITSWSLGAKCSQQTYTLHIPVVEGAAVSSQLSSLKRRGCARY